MSWDKSWKETRGFLGCLLVAFFLVIGLAVPVAALVQHVLRQTGHLAP
jgi:hypothetical protein